MSLPPRLQAKILDRFDEMIGEGSAIYRDMKVVPGEWREPFVRTQEAYKTPDRNVIEWPRFVQWRENSASLLDQVIPKSSIHRESIVGFLRLSNRRDHLEYGIAKLKALRNDFEHGFLDDLVHQIEGEIAGDYLGQAESLIGEGQHQQFDHVPAAVLTGAVLERGLRAICSAQEPPISAVGSDGRPLTLGRLTDALKAAAVFNELLAKQLRAWADIRNAAAHGEFEKFSRSDVETMLAGVKSFLAQYHP